MKDMEYGSLWKVILSDLEAYPSSECDYLVYANNAFDAGKIALGFSPGEYPHIKSITYIETILLLDARTTISRSGMARLPLEKQAEAGALQE